MRLVDASLFIDPSAENLQSPGLAPPYAASPSPSPTRWLFNHGGLTWNPAKEMGTAEDAAAAALTESEMSEKGETNVFHHLQRDSDNHSVNTECDLLFDMAGGMIMSPPRPGMNFSGEEAALFLSPNFHAGMGMGGGMMISMSPPRMNYFSPPSGDSIGNSDPFSLCNFADHSEAQELENRKGIMMQPTWKQQPCIQEVDAVLGQKNQTLGIWPAASRGGTVRQNCLEIGDDYSVNNVDGWFHMPTQLASHDSLPLRGSFYPYRFLDDGAYSVELHNRETITKVTVSWIDVDSQLFSHKEFWFNIAVQAMEKGLPVAHTDVHLSFKFKYTTFSLIEVEVGIPQKSVTHPPRSARFSVRCSAVFEFLEKELGDTFNSIQPIMTSFKMAPLQIQHQNSLKRQLQDNLERLVAELEKCDWKLNPQCEGHIPKSSATNEERNNFVELDNSIDDAKGGNSSSHKTATLSRWEKDHGITRQVLQQLFGKSRDAAAETLKVSISTFKRACRDFGINRWPNHKGKMSNCSLNQKQDVQAVKKHKGIQPCPALPPLQATNTSQCNSTMSVKVTYKNDTIRFPLSSSTMKYLEEQLETKLKISLEIFSIKYQDEEDEWITVTCDSELLHGLDVLRSCGKTVIRMMVTPKFD
nr:protein NLP7-like [Ipomoea batatas]GMD51214.1 protein NLP7-like [Ipomoea batatas]GMD62192.1 protein NLP7-like [Ipomoea batatas]GME17071.1 protein NLP7-like [Ipomoea batatas]GME17072.1 protein NLP7-like [Ipomoea batatas]